MPRHRLQTALDVGATALVFALLTATPAPDVNETHYLSQARHLWDASWCPDDLLLSANKAHAAFFWLLGGPTRWLTLAQFAWAGRLATWLFQAWAFAVLIRAVNPARGLAPVAALLFVGVQQWTMFAGEWIVGGFEAKPLAYGCVLLALAAALDRRWGAAAVWVGAGTALHPLVGGWSLVGLAGQWLSADRDLAALRRVTPWLALGALLALTGVGPALQLDRGASLEVARQAHAIYVYERLPHHLDPQTFRPAPILVSAALSIGVLLRAWSQGDARRSLWGFLAAAIAVALLGFVIRGLGGPGGADLLRFYWFRLIDFAVPLCVVTALCAEAPQAPSAWIRGLGAALGVLLAMPLISARIDDWRRGCSAAEAMLSAQARADWRDVCAAADRLTPRAARFVTPRNLQTFKWRAERAEVANWKDVPQSAVGIVEWKRRLDELHRSAAQVAETQLGTPQRAAASAELARVARAYGADYILRYRQPRLALPIVYENNSFAIYRVPDSP